VFQPACNCMRSEVREETSEDFIADGSNYVWDHAAVYILGLLASIRSITTKLKYSQERQKLRGKE
jgi:hypothetical protein